MNSTDNSAAYQQIESIQLRRQTAWQRRDVAFMARLAMFTWWARWQRLILFAKAQIHR